MQIRVRVATATIVALVLALGATQSGAAQPQGPFVAVKEAAARNQSEPQRLQAAVASQNMQLLPAPPGEATLAFANYSLPNDSLTLTFAIEPKSIQTVDVSTWLDQPSKVVNLVVQFATLPDGTDHPSNITLSLPSKQSANHGCELELPTSRVLTPG